NHSVADEVRRLSVLGAWDLVLGPSLVPGPSPVPGPQSVPGSKIPSSLPALHRTKEGPRTTDQARTKSQGPSTKDHNATRFATPPRDRSALRATRDRPPPASR